MTEAPSSHSQLNAQARASAADPQETTFYELWLSDPVGTDGSTRASGPALYPVRTPRAHIAQPNPPPQTAMPKPML